MAEMPLSYPGFLASRGLLPTGEGTGMPEAEASGIEAQAAAEIERAEARLLTADHLLRLRALTMAGDMSKPSDGEASTLRRAREYYAFLSGAEADVTR